MSNVRVLALSLPLILAPAARADTTVAVGGQPLAAVVDPLTHRTYVANSGDDTVTVIDGADLSTQTVAVGDQPQALAVDPGRNVVYVANLLSADVTVIDGTDLSTQTVAVGGQANAIAVDPVTNRVFVTHFFDGTVTVVDGGDLSTQTVTVGAGPWAVAVNVVTSDVYVTNANGASVTVIDGGDLSTQTVAVGDIPQPVAVDPVTNRAYVSSVFTGTVTEIDGTDLSTRTVPVGTDARWLAVDPVANTIYVANQDDDTVTVIDGGDLSTQTVAVGDSPSGLAVSSATGRVFVANSGSNTVSIIDGSTLSKKVVPAGLEPLAVAVDPITQRVTVVNGVGGTCTVIDGTEVASGFLGLTAGGRSAVDPSRNRVYIHSTSLLVVENDAPLGPPVVLTAPFSNDIAVNPVSNKVYLSSRDFGGAGWLTEVDGESLEETIGPALESAGPIAVNPVTNRIYVANNQSSTPLEYEIISVDGTDLSSHAIPVGESTSDIAVDVVRNRIYAVGGDLSGGCVTVIDGTDDSADVIPVGPEAISIAVNPVTNRAYVAHDLGVTSSITVIDGEDLSIQTIPVTGTRLIDVEVNPVTSRVYGAFKPTGTAVILDEDDLSTQTVTWTGAPALVTDLEVDIRTDRACIMAFAPGGGLAMSIVDGVDSSGKSLGVLTAEGGSFDTMSVDTTRSRAYLDVTTDSWVVDLDARSDVPLDVAITPLDGPLFDASPAFSLEATSGFAPDAPSVVRIWTQVDTITGAWTPAPTAGPSATVQLDGLVHGDHVLYACATDGQDATDGSPTSGSGPLVGEIAAYPFTVTLPWTNEGNGLPGTDGVPLLTGTGSLEPDTPLTITLAHALPNTIAGLAFGIARLDVPFKGGILVPDITAPGFLLTLPIGPTGTLVLPAMWPPGVPPGATIYMQYWVQDPGGPKGFAASNAISGTSP